ncbi:MAG: amidohydrolase family protein [Streptosporangiales bacterium]|nr:amidohydrolase family protein [Streptosporangiales bacterium]
MADLLVTGGTVVDGTGNPGYPATLAVEGDRVRILRGNGEPPPAGRVIDATGMVVAPGFIDMHSHSGLMIFAEPTHLPKVSQGVTTELIGVDGCSYAPFTDPDELRRFVTFNAGLDGCPDLGYDWDTVASYLTRFDNEVAVNIGCLVGNSALRIAALGWDQVPADQRAVANMRAMLREALEEGAFGMSTGLDYPPGSYASTEELGELCKEPARVGGLYHTHVRYWMGDQFLDPFREAFEITRQGGCPLHLTHFYHKAKYPRGSDVMFDLLEREVGLGVDVTFDAYPYEWSSTRLTILLPQWIQAGGPEPTLARLADPDCRERFKAELANGDPDDTWRAAHEWVRLGHFGEPHNRRYENMTMAAVARERRQDVVDAFLDLLVEENLRINEVQPGPTGSTLAKFVTHRLGMVGTDSVFIGDKPSPRTYGSFPRILGEFVREERHLSLPEAVRKFTSFPAGRLGLPDRGLLRDGFAADVVVFDPERVRAVATYDQPRRQSLGIEYVIVNGTVVLDRGTHTGALPGRGLRRGHTR